MKTNGLLLVIFISIVFYAFSDGNSFKQLMRIGGTQLNGSGCVCHNLQSDPNVHVWVTGPDTLISGQTAEYKMFLYGGSAIAGGYNIAVRYGTLNVAGYLSLLIDNELTQAFPLLFPSTQDTIFWPFLYTAPDSVDIDTIYSVGLSSNFDGDPNVGDTWQFGPKFPVRVLHDVTPVELVSFSSEVENSGVRLSWKTSTETNNKGFEVQRKNNTSEKSKWETISFVNGNGTSSNIHSYSYLDKNLNFENYSYRLKQVDYNGSFEYSKIINVELGNTVESYVLNQNYPNPFNPGTTISYELPQSANVIIKVYDVLGNEVKTLVNNNEQAGKHQIYFDASKLSSGIYLYKMQAGKYSEIKKMILLK